ncbi:MAG: Rpn family recombination-promoting nuclease/putative transposase, partial [Candidatus Margulisbacteria bacterium]|nr:Rpn family recombination-promoting nuclease/putative transposase [Candidatus Margulisiibacteriota bacterium]
LAVTNDGAKINIEVQLCNLGDMDRRSLFYWSREYARGIKAGENYLSLPKVITINIVNFEFIPLPEFQTSFRLREDRYRDYVLTDVLEIHFIDMVKFRRLPEKDIGHNDLHRDRAWLPIRRGSPSEQQASGVLAGIF